jgi:hypothetical protein
VFTGVLGEGFVSGLSCGFRTSALALDLLPSLGVNPELVSVRQLRVGDRVIAVEIFRNEGGSFAARCRIGAGDAPIIDGPSEDEVVAAVEESLEGLLFARAFSSASAA